MTGSNNRTSNSITNNTEIAIAGMTKSTQRRYFQTGGSALDIIVLFETLGSGGKSVIVRFGDIAVSALSYPTARNNSTGIVFIETINCHNEIQKTTVRKGGKSGFKKKTVSAAHAASCG